MPEVFVPKNQSQEPAKEEHFSPKIGEAGEVKTLLQWQGPIRPFRPKDRSYYTTIAILVLLLGIIAFLANEFLLIGVLLALTFVAYVLAYVPPGSVKYRISTQGVIIGDHFYFWHELDSSSGSGGVGEEEVKKEVARFLPYHEIPKSTFMDRWSDRLQKHFPLENVRR